MGRVGRRQSNNLLSWQLGVLPLHSPSYKDEEDLTLGTHILHCWGACPYLPPEDVVEDLCHILLGLRGDFFLCVHHACVCICMCVCVCVCVCACVCVCVCVRMCEVCQLVSSHPDMKSSQEQQRHQQPSFWLSTNLKIKPVQILH